MIMSESGFTGLEDLQDWDNKHICLRNPVRLCAGRLCIFRLNSVRSLKWISSNKRSAVRGKTYASPPQLRKELKSSASLNSIDGLIHQWEKKLNSLRSSDRAWTVYPELRSACTGLSKFNSLRSLTTAIMWQFTKPLRAKYNPVNPENPDSDNCRRKNHLNQKNHSSDNYRRKQ
jgi:hypothetical protein